MHHTGVTVGASSGWLYQKVTAGQGAPIDNDLVFHSLFIVIGEILGVVAPILIFQVLAA